MTRPLSKLAPGWWDYTTLDSELLAEAARIDERKLRGLSRPGFTIHFYDTIQEFYAAEALEYIDAWQKSTPDNPACISTICVPALATSRWRCIDAIQRDSHPAR